ncbi:hypothetical protein A152_0016620 [Vibrio tasmaniensis 1F-187]|uniref:hypothetical protein n=1 Tax=unclassified Vibrio TaxID=2614977 RepID=UPI00086A1B26|nr:hypothetical protein [Vibrio tasmaniensis]OEF73225.1 hypothetical protein A152_10820 [Vibrio tasmaniensis 1F-187]
MMKLSDSRENYYTFSGSLSSVCRQLAFAGIAVCWVFTIKNETSYIIDKTLVIALISFVAGLIFDLFHYFYASFAWGFFTRCKEKELSGRDELFQAPLWINWPTLFFFWLKPISMILGYLVLFKFLLSYIAI